MGQHDEQPEQGPIEDPFSIPFGGSLFEHEEKQGSPKPALLVQRLRLTSNTEVLELREVGSEVSIEIERPKSWSKGEVFAIPQRAGKSDLWICKISSEALGNGLEMAVWQFGNSHVWIVREPYSWSSLEVSAVEVPVLSKVTKKADFLRYIFMFSRESGNFFDWIKQKKVEQKVENRPSDLKEDWKAWFATQEHTESSEVKADEKSVVQRNEKALEEMQRKVEGIDKLGFRLRMDI